MRPPGPNDWHLAVHGKYGDFWQHAFLWRDQNRSEAIEILIGYNSVIGNAARRHWWWRSRGIPSATTDCAQAENTAKSNEQCRQTHAVSTGQLSRFALKNDHTPMLDGFD